MTDTRVKENMTLYRKGFALVNKREGGHITGDYDILEDTVDEDGTRTIRLKPRDKAQFLASMKELIKLLLEKLGESESKSFKALLEDTLVDYDDEDVERMLKTLQEGKTPVKTSKGCFDIIIGDGRKRKGTDRIILRP